MSKRSQAEQVLTHIKRHGSINPLTAITAYGCMRLAARICDLRDAGYNIVTDMVKTSEGKQYARYRLGGAQRVRQP